MKKRVNSSQKGKRGEREFAAHLRDLGFEARRGQQHKGGNDSPDVLCPDLAGLHFEVKFGYAKTDLDLGTALLAAAQYQATCEAPKGSVPIVAWKPRGTRYWRYTLSLTRDTYCITDPNSEADFLRQLARK